MPRLLDFSKNFCYNKIVKNKEGENDMDLYEALKAGTSAEELLAAFHKDLDAATARITEEKNTAADQEYLAECRSALADAIVDYTIACCDEEELDENELDSDKIEEILIDFEKEMDGIHAFKKELNRILTQAKRENKKPVDIKVVTHYNDVPKIFLSNIR